MPLIQRPSAVTLGFWIIMLCVMFYNETLVHVYPTLQKGKSELVLRTDKMSKVTIGKKKKKEKN